MVAEQVFPVVSVAHESDVYLKWDKASAFRVMDSKGRGTLRADGAESKTEDYGGTWTSYQAEEYAVRTRITDRERANADQVYMLEQSKVRRAQDKILLDYEIRVANTVTTTGNYASSNLLSIATGTGQWNNASFASQTTGQHSVIAGQIFTGINAIRQSTGGKTPNKIIIPFKVAQVMRNDVGLVDLIKYQATTLNDGANLLPPVLWGMDVLVPRTPMQTAVEGEPVSLSDVWGNNVILLYVPTTPTLDDLALGYTIRSRPWQVKTWREERFNATFYEAGFVQTEQLITADAGYLISNCCA